MTTEVLLRPSIDISDQPDVDMSLPADTMSANHTPWRRLAAVGAVLVLAAGCAPEKNEPANTAHHTQAPAPATESQLFTIPTGGRIQIQEIENKGKVVGSYGVALRPGGGGKGNKGGSEDSDTETVLQLPAPADVRPTKTTKGGGSSPSSKPAKPVKTSPTATPTRTAASPSPSRKGESEVEVEYCPDGSTFNTQPDKVGADCKAVDIPLQTFIDTTGIRSFKVGDSFTLKVSLGGQLD